MSIEALAWAWKRPEIESPVTMVIMHHLADSANPAENENTRWKLTGIAERCRCTKVTVRRQLLIIWKLGLIDKISEHKPNQKAAVYRVNCALPDLLITQRRARRGLYAGTDSYVEGYQIVTPMANDEGDHKDTPDNSISTAEGDQKDTPTGITELPEGDLSDTGGGSQLTPKPNKPKETKKEKSFCFFDELKTLGYFSDSNSYASQTFFDEFAKNQYTLKEFQSAHEITMGEGGPGKPSINYLNGVMKRARTTAERSAAKPKKPSANKPQQIESTDPTENPELEAATQRAHAAKTAKYEKINEQERQKKAEAQQAAEAAVIHSEAPSKSVDKVVNWFLEMGYDESKVKTDTNLVRISMWVNMGVGPKVLDACLTEAIDTRAKQQNYSIDDPIAVINQQVMRSLRAKNRTSAAA